MAFLAFFALHSLSAFFFSLSLQMLAAPNVAVMKYQKSRAKMLPSYSRLSEIFDFAYGVQDPSSFNAQLVKKNRPSGVAFNGRVSVPMGPLICGVC